MSGTLAISEKVVENKNTPPAKLFNKKQHNAVLVCKLAAKNVWHRLTRPHSLLLTLTLLGVILGISIGTLIRKYAVSSRGNGASPGKALTARQISYLNFLGELFLRALKMIIMPLMFFTLINSVATLDMKTAGRLLMTAFVYYFSTMFLATIIGISLVISIKPGTYSPIIRDDQASDKESMGCSGTTACDAILDIIRNVVSDNILQTGLQTVYTCPKFTFNKTVPITYATYENMSLDMKALVVEDLKFEKRDSINLNGLVAFSLLIGAILSKLNTEAKPVIDFSLVMEKVITQMVRLFIWFSPLGVMSLIAAEVANIDDIKAEVKRLGIYMITVIAGLAVHACLVLPCLLFFLGRRNPLKFISGVSEALFVAFGTCSSNATLPVTLQCMEHNVKIDKRVVKFLIPLGVSLNMNGTALYEAVASVYIAQCLGVELKFGELLLVCITAVFAAMGTGGVPQGGLVTLVMVLMAIGLPSKYIILIVPVDWILGRCRTVVNVFDDAVACAIIQRVCQGHLQKIDEMECKKPSTHSINQGNLDTKC